MANLNNQAMNMLVDTLLNRFERNAGRLTPIQQHYIDVLRSGNSEEGMALANNLCNTMGESREQALANASRFFNI